MDEIGALQARSGTVLTLRSWVDDRGRHRPRSEMAVAGAAVVVLGVALLAFSGTLRRAPAARAAGAPLSAGVPRPVEALPFEARAVSSGTPGAAAPAFQAHRTSVGCRLGSGALAASFSLHDATVSTGGQSLSMTLSAIGRPERLLATPPASLHAHANRVIYNRAAVSEWYAAVPVGPRAGIHRYPPASWQERAADACACAPRLTARGPSRTRPPRPLS